jgi:dihydrofolate reductase
MVTYMRNTVYIAQSLDGYIADKNGGLDWLNNIPNPENNDFGFADFIENIDAIVMGRNTFQKVLTLGDWPYTKPVYVISSSLNKIPNELSDKVTILNSNPSELVKRLNQKGHKNLYIDGGLLIQSFLSEDLIDELIITTIPILLGGGIPLFGDLNNSMKFSHVKTEVLLNSLVKSYYKRQR